MDWKKALQVVLPFLGPVSGAIAGGAAGGGDRDEVPFMNELQQLLQLQNARMRATDPLYKNTLYMAEQGMPLWARKPSTPMTPDRPGADGRQPGPGAERTGRHAIPRIPEY